MITSQQLKEAIRKHKLELPRLQKLYNYYVGKHEILNRVLPDPLKPNNKIVTGYPTRIIDTAVGYFASKPLAYVSKSNNEKFLNELKQIFFMNNEEDVNAEIVKGFSIYGKTYELFWIDENGDIKFDEFSPLEMYVEKDNKDNVKFAIRYWEETNENNDKITKVEAYDKEGIHYFIAKNDQDFKPDLDEKDKSHFFGETPVIIYRNNDEEFGDFEKFIPMIDALDKLLSDNSNELEAWVNAYLVLAGHDGTKTEDVLKLRQEGVLLVEDVNQAKFLTKEVNTEFQQQFFDTLDNLIHDQSATPKLTSEKFASNLSGQALGFKLFSLESKSSTKERKMEKALRKRISLICRILNKKGNSFDPSDIGFNFVRNLPQNKSEITDMMTKLVNMVDLKTLLSWHPDITDVDLVLGRIEEQKDSMDLDKIEQFQTGKVHNE